MDLCLKFNGECVDKSGPVSGDLRELGDPGAELPRHPGPSQGLYLPSPDDSPGRCEDQQSRHNGRQGHEADLHVGRLH